MLAEKPEARYTDILHPSHQPFTPELNEHMRINATFKEAVDALARPVRIRCIYRPKGEKIGRLLHARLVPSCMIRLVIREQRMIH